MTLYKLYTHTKSYSDADLLLNTRDNSDAKLGDIVEIYHRDEESGPRLLLQITKFNDLKARDVISIDSVIAAIFNLKTFNDVVMRVVNADSVALDSIELTFKDQYMGRSEMWRIKTYLTNTCVYINKKIEYKDIQIRCQVCEMWSQGERVACGVINEDTKIVFRSSTSMVYLFLQMSSEMWEFDIHGDLYFEKAVNGFLTELFHKWKKLSCNHEVTIVLFSRTFYVAKSLEEFPEFMRECLQMDYKGRFYEDFYRVVIQNERNDDWCTVLPQLRKLLPSYQATVLRFHEREGVKIPTAYNSSAQRGNFLEVLNISLNTFEKHYLDRTFDRTGQLSVVITPGVGVFEVDRELTNITKQRIIDNGVGSDLVCVGEQPLHAVPLLKFHNKDTFSTVADDFSLPHWINLSFYCTNKKLAYSNFIPRIKLPSTISDAIDNNEQKQYERYFLSCNQSEYIHNSLFDYDAYDEQVFQPPPAQGTCSLRIVRVKKTSLPSLDTYGHQHKSTSSQLSSEHKLRRKMSDPDIYYGTSVMLASLTDTESSVSNAGRNVISLASCVRPGRALINPFDPTHLTIKLTSNRRRWTHIFPKGPTGVLIQQHHYQAVPAQPQVTPTLSNNVNSVMKNCDGVDYELASVSSSLSRLNSTGEPFDGDSSTFNYTTGQVPKAMTYLWGATGEQEWTPAITTGVDWKSLTVPACLPITTDYFPDKRSLHNDYVITDYTLLPDDVNYEYALHRAVYRRPLTADIVFKEIISQRLAQGFQLIVLEEKNKSISNNIKAASYNNINNQGNIDNPTNNTSAVEQLHNNATLFSKTPPKYTKNFWSMQTAHSNAMQMQQQQKKPQQMQCKTTVNQFALPQANEISEECLLSIGRIFHRITLKGSVITVTGYRPRHPYPPINYEYRYRFYAPQHESYEISGVNFATEKLEKFNWNYMDHYVSTRGDRDYPLVESLKYWRYRMYLLPKESVAMNKIIDFGSKYCDIFTDLVVDNTRQQIDDFLRFIETHLNKLKRQRCRRSRDSPTTQSHLTRRRHSTSIISRSSNQVLTDSPFRERVGSNRLPEKRPSIPKPITKIDRGRISPATDAAVTLNTDASNREDADGFSVQEVKLHSNAPLIDIFKAMSHPVSGVGFLATTQGLPSCTFVSFDALLWLKERLENSGRNPLDILEDMRREKLICHASGDWNKPVLPGFMLYFIAQQDKTSKDFVKPLNSLEVFESEWVEVEIKGCNYLWMDDTVEIPVPKFLRDNLPLQTWLDHSLKKQIYQHCHLEIDVNQRSNRMEWGHVKYHTLMQPGFAYELVVEWVTASGPIVYDLIYGWVRKANQCNFQLVSVPSNPMAEPYTEKSDPLRAPIFIPLAMNFLESSEILFEEFSEDSRADRLLFFQEAILARFGFLSCVPDKRVNDMPKEYQYVHCSGNMFVLIRCSKNYVPVESPTREEMNITRYVYGHTTNTNVPKKVGFLWSWNHMIPNKKWKSLTINNSKDGELFQLKMLNDFREFCSNKEERLQRFYLHCKDLKQKYALNRD